MIEGIKFELSKKKTMVTRRNKGKVEADSVWA